MNSWLGQLGVTRCRDCVMISQDAGGESPNAIGINLHLSRYAAAKLRDELNEILAEINLSESEAVYRPPVVSECVESSEQTGPQRIEVAA